MVTQCRSQEKQSTTSKRRKEERRIGEADESLVMLVTRAQEGDRTCIEELTLRVQPRLRSFFMRHLPDPELAEELLQETLLRMLQSLSRLRDVKVFWPWLYRIAHNQIRNHFRDRSRHATVWFSGMEPNHLDGLLHDDSHNAGRSLLKRELKEQLCKAVTQLKKLPRAIVSMRYYEDLSYAQISDRLGCTEINARASFSRAKKVLRRQLKLQGVSGM
ncbi:MAG: sigma-70 family RNA polymerase sigma factor [Sedimentisphaerales bacterium]|nr:sigma-70 family RNA polymerase sigma factor [Sedimentisphaerales bacterium]